MDQRGEHARDETWPDLDLPTLAETITTMRFWSQIVGKTRLALSPPENHWWHVPLYVSARGLTTSSMPSRGRNVEVELDLLAHRLVLRESDGELDSMPLESGTLRDFFARYFDMLRRHHIDVSIWPIAVEVVEHVRLDRDEVHRPYAPEASSRFFRALIQADQVLKEFRGAFIGKASPVHFFWGSFDLAVTRFSGRRAPLHPGGAPHCPDWVMREAYSHEVSSSGFWPGDARMSEPAFYAYSYPEPPGFAAAEIEPAAARYERVLGEYVLPYAAVRAAPDPAGTVRAFLETTYAAAANLAVWDRVALESPTRGKGGTEPRGIVAFDPSLA